MSPIVHRGMTGGQSVSQPRAPTIANPDPEVIVRVAGLVAVEEGEDGFVYTLSAGDIHLSVERREPSRSGAPPQSGRVFARVRLLDSLRGRRGGADDPARRELPRLEVPVVSHQVVIRRHDEIEAGSLDGRGHGDGVHRRQISVGFLLSLDGVGVHDEIMEGEFPQIARLSGARPAGHEAHGRAPDGYASIVGDHPGDRAGDQGEGLEGIDAPPAVILIPSRCALVLRAVLDQRLHLVRRIVRS